MAKKMTIKEAVKITGGLSSPGKMPCRSFNLPALITCPLGRELAKQPGTSCSDCYALKGRYYFSNVKAAMNRRYKLLKSAIKNPVKRWRWVQAMTFLINNQSPKYFRWHDSGDIFNADYLLMIFDVAYYTPRVHHWIPTKELALVSQHRHIIPSNVTFRISSANQSRPLDTNLPVAHVEKMDDYGTPESIKRVAAAGGLLCLAKARMKKKSAEQACGNCRACWDPNIKTIVYPLH